LSRRVSQENRHKKLYYELQEKGELREANLQAARRFFQSDERARIHKNQRTGKLNTRQLVKASTGSREVFLQDRTRKVLKNTVVQVVVDISGSMAGTKVVYAAHTCLIINKLCELFNLNTEVLGFTSAWSGNLIHCVYKKFGSRMRDDDFLDGFWSSLKHMNQNNDGDSILFARERLLNTGKDKRKIMFVLSDGLPAGPRGDIETFTHDVVKKIEKEKWIEIYGIGILSKYVEEFYKDHMVVWDIRELEKSLLDFFKRVMYLNCS